MTPRPPHIANRHTVRVPFAALVVLRFGDRTFDYWTLLDALKVWVAGEASALAVQIDHNRQYLFLTFTNRGTAERCAATWQGEVV